MTQNEYDELLDTLNAAEYRSEKARRAVLASDTAETRETWNIAKKEVADLTVSVKLAAETL